MGDCSRRAEYSHIGDPNVFDDIFCGLGKGSGMRKQHRDLVFVGNRGHGKTICEVVSSGKKSPLLKTYAVKLCNYISDHGACFITIISANAKDIMTSI